MHIKRNRSSDYISNSITTWIILASSPCFTVNSHYNTKKSGSRYSLSICLIVQFWCACVTVSDEKLLSKSVLLP